MPVYELATLEYIMYIDILKKKEDDLRGQEDAKENASKDGDKKSGPAPRPTITDNDLMDVLEEEGLM